MGKAIPRSLASRRLHGVASRRVCASRPHPSACPGSLRLSEHTRALYQFRRPALALCKVREATQAKYTSLLSRPWAGSTSCGCRSGRRDDDTIS